MPEAKRTKVGDRDRERAKMAMQAWVTHAYPCIGMQSRARVRIRASCLPRMTQAYMIMLHSMQTCTREGVSHTHLVGHDCKEQALGLALLDRLVRERAQSDGIGLPVLLRLCRKTR